MQSFILWFVLLVMLNIIFTLIFKRFTVSKKIDSLRESESRFNKLTETAKNTKKKEEMKRNKFCCFWKYMHYAVMKVNSLLIYLFTYLCVKSPRWFHFRLNNAANIESSFECWLFLAYSFAISVKCLPHLHVIVIIAIMISVMILEFWLC